MTRRMIKFSKESEREGSSLPNCTMESSSLGGFSRATEGALTTSIGREVVSETGR